MRDAGPMARVAYLLRFADGPLMRATMKDFEPAVPTSGEDLVAAGTRFLIGWGTSWLRGPCAVGGR
jgi:hypothetical protein